MLVVGDADVVVAVVVRLVVVGREVVVFFVVVGALELLGVEKRQQGQWDNGLPLALSRLGHEPPHAWPEKRQSHEDRPDGTVKEPTEDEETAKDDTDNRQDGFYDLRPCVGGGYHADASIMMPNCGVDMRGVTGSMGAITSCRCLSKCRAP